MSNPILDEQDKNLLVVVAVEGYAQNHKTETKDAFQQLKQKNVINLIRKNYESLHTQDLEETVAFTEDVMRIR